jgi:hypothetical protein
MPRGLYKKTLKLKWDDIYARLRENITGMVWKTNERFTYWQIGNRRQLLRQTGDAQNPVIVTDSSQHMGYIDKGDRIADGSLINWWIWKWIKNYFSTSWN